MINKTIKKAFNIALCIGCLKIITMAITISAFEYSDEILFICVSDIAWEEFLRSKQAENSCGSSQEGKVSKSKPLDIFEVTG